MPNESIWKEVVSYPICFILLVVLIEGAWGLTGGALIGLDIGDGDIEEISNILKEKGIKDPDAAKSRDEDWYKKLPPDVKRDIERDIGNVVKRKLQDINWFGVTLAVSAFVFAVVGFLCGFLNRVFIPIGILVVLSFLVNNPIVRFPHAKALGSLQKVIVILTQFGICYLFGYLGALIGMRRYNKRLDARGI